MQKALRSLLSETAPFFCTCTAKTSIIQVYQMSLSTGPNPSLKHSCLPHTTRSTLTCAHTDCQLWTEEQSAWGRADSALSKYGTALDPSSRPYWTVLSAFHFCITAFFLTSDWHSGQGPGLALVAAPPDHGAYPCGTEGEDECPLITARP